MDEREHLTGQLVNEAKRCRTTRIAAARLPASSERAFTVN